MCRAAKEWLKTGAGESKYRYNNKELNQDFGLDWYDYGARWYDSSIGRFGAIDRFAEKYYPMAPYQYGANNPIKFVDVNGDSIYINSNGMTVAYVPGAEYQGKDDFIELTWQALDFISSNFDDEGYIEDMAFSESFNLDVAEGFAMDIPIEQGGGKVENYFETRPTGLSDRDALTLWTPDVAFDFGEGFRSPVENFYHELVHASNLKSDRKATLDRQKQKVDGPLGNKEEALVIQNFENRAAKRMIKTGGVFGGDRNCHKCSGSRYYKATNPWSIWPAKN